jgi:hypothetical protein
LKILVFVLKEVEGFLLFLLVDVEGFYFCFFMLKVITLILGCSKFLLLVIDVESLALIFGY